MKGICTNCMGYGEILSCPVGPDQGTQRDLYREQILLCGTCMRALVGGRLGEFHSRYGKEVTVTRDDLERKKEGHGRLT